MISGLCIGGPMSGQNYSGDGEKGVVFVDKRRNQVHVYDWNGKEFIYVRSDNRDLKKEEKALFDPGRDIRVPRGVEHAD